MIFSSKLLILDFQNSKLFNGNIRRKYSTSLDLISKYTVFTILLSTILLILIINLKISIWQVCLHLIIKIFYIQNYVCSKLN